MVRKMIVGVLLVLLMALAACGGGEAATAGVSDTALTQGAGLSDLALTTSLQLQVGTLLLEETPHRITQTQAQELLPLWQMLRALQENGTASQLETQATLDQIQETMTPEQLAAIEEMNPEDMRTLVQEFAMRAVRMEDDSQSAEGGGFQPPDMEMIPPLDAGPGMGPVGDLSPEERATAMAGQRSSVSGTALTDVVIEYLETLVAPSEVVVENPTTDTTEISEATPTPRARSSEIFCRGLNPSDIATGSPARRTDRPSTLSKS